MMAAAQTHTSEDIELIIQQCWQQSRERGIVGKKEWLGRRGDGGGGGGGICGEMVGMRGKGCWGDSGKGLKEEVGW